MRFIFKILITGGDILFGGKHFAPKPYDAITLVVWVNVDSTTGKVKK